MLNTHNSLIIREQQNKIEAPADSREKDSHFDCPFLVNSVLPTP